MDEGVWTCLTILQPFTFRIQFILFAGKKAFEIQFVNCRIPVVLENRRSSQLGGGGVRVRVRTPCTLPLDLPLYYMVLHVVALWKLLSF